MAMFYCGDAPEAKRSVSSLIAELGFELLDAGPLTQARFLEPFAMLWISLALKYGFGREIGFRLLRGRGWNYSAAPRPLAWGTLFDSADFAERK